MPGKFLFHMVAYQDWYGVITLAAYRTSVGKTRLSTILAREFVHERNNAQAYCGSWYLHERLGKPQPVLT